MFGQTTAAPPPPKKIANIDENQVATNQQAIPVPYVRGRARCALHYIAPIYNKRAEKVTTQVGKGDETTVGYIYFGDIAGVVSVVGRRVPMLRLYKHILDSQVVWENAAGLLIGNPYSPVTIDNYGLTRIYAGRSDQPQDDLVLTPLATTVPPGVDPRDPTTFPNGDDTSNLPGTQTGHYDNHPAYRYQVYIVGQDIKFGRDRNQVPNWEVEIGGTCPWFTSGAPLSLFDEGVNPVGVIFEPLTDDVFGAGLAESDLDQDSFEAIRTKLGNAGFRISVNQSEQTDLRSYLTKVFEYFDGFLYRKGTTIALGMWEQGNIDVDSLPVIGSDDLTAEPKVRSTGYDDCLTEVNVIYKDRAHYFHDASASYRNPGLQQTIGEFRSVFLQRPFIIDDAMAQSYATFWGQKYGRPGATGELEVKLEKVEKIEDGLDTDGVVGPIVGRRVKTDSASLGFEFVFRVVECEYPGSEGPFNCTLTVELERTIWPSIFIQPPPKKIGNFLVTVPKIVNYKIAELPAGLKTATGIQITILAQRPGKSVIGFHTWNSADDITFLLLNPPCLFAAYGKLTVMYPDTTPDVDQTVGMTFKLYGVDLVPDSEGHILDYSVLCFVDNEIMSVGHRQALGNGVYKTWMYRGRYGTFKADHLVNAQCYFILRENLPRLTNKAWNPGQTWHFKQQTFDPHQDFNLADFTSFPFLITGGAVGIPTLNTPTSDFVITTEGKVNSRITVTWSYVTDYDLTGFNVRVRHTTFGFEWINQSFDIQTTGMFQNLEPNKQYEVQIQGRAATGENSPWSASKLITTAGPNVPGTPTGLVATGIADGVLLEWTNATTGGIRGTNIMWSALDGSIAHGNIMDGEIPISERRFTFNQDVAGFGVTLWFHIRHVNTIDVEGSWTPATDVSAEPKFVS